MRLLVHMPHPEAGWQRLAKMRDYPGLYLTPISVHMAYSYLLVLGFRLIFSPFNSTNLHAHGRATPHPVRSNVVGGRQLVPTSRTGAVVVRVFIFQLSCEP